MNPELKALLLRIAAALNQFRAAMSDSLSDAQHTEIENTLQAIQNTEVADEQTLKILTGQVESLLGKPDLSADVSALTDSVNGLLAREADRDTQIANLTAQVQAIQQDRTAAQAGISADADEIIGDLSSSVSTSLSSAISSDVSTSLSSGVSTSLSTVSSSVSTSLSTLSSAVSTSLSTVDSGVSTGVSSSLSDAGGDPGISTSVSDLSSTASDLSTGS